VRDSVSPVAVISLVWHRAAERDRTWREACVVMPARYAVARVTVGVTGQAGDAGDMLMVGGMPGETAATCPHRSKGDCWDSYGGGHGSTCGFEVPLTALRRIWPPAVN